MVSRTDKSFQVDKFNGRYRFLSNFWEAPVTLDGMLFPSVEHAYQAAKTLDMNKRQEIAELPEARQAKRRGKRLQMRPDWDQVKLSIMEDLVRQKFTRHENLKQLLLDTGDAELIEGNTWGDCYWGMCNGTGLNYLGQIIMQVRAELRGQKLPTPQEAMQAGYEQGQRDTEPLLRDTDALIGHPREFGPTLANAWAAGRLDAHGDAETFPADAGKIK